MEDFTENKDNTISNAGTIGRKDYFNIKTHEVMLDDAFVGSIYTKDQVRWMRFGIGFWSDVVLMLKESVHLDNHRGNDVMVKAYQGAIDGFRAKARKKDFIGAGVCLHTIGDFYAHSNYIDFYSLYAQRNGLSLDIIDIPCFSALMADEDFLAFARSQGELRAGTYGLISDIIEKIFKTKPKEGSHTLMNLDSNNSPNGGKPFAPGMDFTKHEASVRVAYEECRALLQE